MLSYSVAQRTQEIGVRVALGAGRMDVLKLVVVQGVRLALIGVVIGAIGSFFVTPIIQSELFSVSSKDPASFIGVSFFLTAVAFIASYVPRAAPPLSIPLVALRVIVGRTFRSRHAAPGSGLQCPHAIHTAWPSCAAALFSRPRPFAARPMTINDLLGAVRVSEPQLSPDGKTGRLRADDDRRRDRQTQRRHLGRAG